jgi:hypothetical protein
MPSRVATSTRIPPRVRRGRSDARLASLQSCSLSQWLGLGSVTVCHSRHTVSQMQYRLLYVSRLVYYLGSTRRRKPYTSIYKRGFYSVDLQMDSYLCTEAFECGFCHSTITTTSDVPDPCSLLGVQLQPPSKPVLSFQESSASALLWDECMHFKWSWLLRGTRYTCFLCIALKGYNCNVNLKWYPRALQKLLIPLLCSGF